MRSLPHLVIACGTVWTSFRLIDRVRSGERGAMRQGALDCTPDPHAAAPLGPTVDYRAVALAAVVPDHFDRALGRYVLRGMFRHNDHLLGHTLLFSAALFLPGILVARRGDARLLAMALATISHLLVDPVVRAPRTLFWPALGLEFSQVEGWGRSLTAASQTLSVLVVTVAGLRLWRGRRLHQLLRRGRLCTEAGALGAGLPSPDDTTRSGVASR